MKTAISIPDGVFRRAERLARRLGVSRSRLYCLAIEEMLSRCADQEVTEALDRVYGERHNCLDVKLAELQAHAVRGDAESW